MGYEGLYEVSNDGEVKSLDKKINWIGDKKRMIKGRMIRPSSTKGKGEGYLFVGLTKDSKAKYVTVHRLVALHFCDNPDNKPEINHDDCNIHNNADWNLWWCTRKENEEHRKKYGIVMAGNDHVFSKLTEKQVIDLRKRYKAGEALPKLLARYPRASSQGIHNAIVGKSWKLINQVESPAGLRREKHKSGFPGVSFDKAHKKWRGRLKVQGKWVDAGRHSTAAKANKALKEKITS